MGRVDGNLSIKAADLTVSIISEAISCALAPETVLSLQNCSVAADVCPVTVAMSTPQLGGI